MALDIDRINAVYLKMRVKKAEITRAFEAEKRDIEQQMETLENVLLGHLQANKVRSMATTSGTVYTEEVMQAQCEDWQAYHAWLIETGRMEGLERRVGQKFIKDYADENEGELPPGIAARRQQVVRIRVAST